MSALAPAAIGLSQLQPRAESSGAHDFPALVAVGVGLEEAGRALHLVPAQRAALQTACLALHFSACSKTALPRLFRGQSVALEAGWVARPSALASARSSTGLAVFRIGLAGDWGVREHLSQLAPQIAPPRRGGVGQQALCRAAQAALSL